MVRSVWKWNTVAEMEIVFSPDHIFMYVIRDARTEYDLSPNTTNRCQTIL